MDGDGSRPARILVVDDDQKVRDVIGAMLESAGYEVSLANNGLEAVSMVQEQSFTAILTDLVMPEKEGIETIKHIREHHPEIKVIAMSGAFGGDYLRIASYLGAHSTLAKPINLKVLLETVAKTIDGRAS